MNHHDDMITIVILYKIHRFHHQINNYHHEMSINFFVSVFIIEFHFKLMNGYNPKQKTLKSSSFF